MTVKFVLPEQIEIAKDPTPIHFVEGDRVQCVTCRAGLARGKQAGTASGCQTVILPVAKHMGTVVKAARGEKYIHVLWDDRTHAITADPKDVVKIR